MPIDREEAGRIAFKYLVQQGVDGPRITSAGKLGEPGVRPRPYGSPDDLSKCWIVYYDTPATQYSFIGSSDIVVVSMETGEVLYAGSGNDEG